MKFSQLAKGIRAEKQVSFRYGGKDIPTLLRPLTQGEEIDVIAKASKAAQRDGVKEPKPGDPIYEAHAMAETLALACLDPDSPADARMPTFDGGPKDLLDMDRDAVAMLFEQQAMWQQECSPAIHTTGTKDLFKLAEEVSEQGDPFAYAALPLVTRWLLQRFTAALLCNSPAYKSWRTVLSSELDFDAPEVRKKIQALIEGTPTTEATS